VTQVDYAIVKKLFSGLTVVISPVFGRDQLGGISMSLSQVDLKEAATLCQAALARLGPNADFRIRVLLEMALIELARSIPKVPRPDTPTES
jgi:hypothetical protein